MKKLISIVLAAALCLSVTISASAAAEQAVAADRLHSLGLFGGVGNNPDGTPNYDLDRVPTRAEAVTMLIALLGKSEEAVAGTWSIPFTDVPNWARPYVGYAYQNGLSAGISDTAFGSTDPVSAAQYLTFVLRALGYTTGKDFAWNSAWTLTDFLGITNGQYNSSASFTRGDAVIASSNALDQNLKGHAITLLDNIQGKKPETYKVIRVVDGDTIVVDCEGTEKTVRLIGVDTPESVHPDASKNTDAGFAASEFTKVYLTDAEVELELDVQEFDQYGRTLAYVYANGEMFNEKLLKTGYASVATYPPNVKYVDRFTKIEAGRDPSIPSGKYYDGYMEAPSAVFKADHLEMEDAFLYVDGQVTESTTKDGHTYYILDTQFGDIFIADMLDLVSYGELDAGDAVKVGFIYAGYLPEYSTPVGVYLEYLGTGSYTRPTPQPSAPEPTPTPAPTPTPTPAPAPPNPTPAYYVGNKNSKVFHRPTCPSVDRMKNSNKVTLSTRTDAIGKGYSPCKNCKP